MMTTTDGTSEGTSQGNDPEIYGDYSVDDEDQLTPEDTLDEADVDDELERGYSPREGYSAGQGFGNTPREEELGESLDQRLAQEVPEPDPYAPSDDEDLDDGEVGDARSGRLVAPDEGAREDTESGLIGDDVGIDGAAASAEEAAVHVVEDQ